MNRTKEIEEQTAKSKACVAQAQVRYQWGDVCGWVVAIERPRCFLWWKWTEWENILQVDHVPAVFGVKADAQFALTVLRSVERFGYSIDGVLET